LKVAAKRLLPAASVVQVTFITEADFVVGGLVEVEALFILDDPAGRDEFFVDLFAGFGFEFWVFR
jgi:hypothetical protein